MKIGRWLARLFLLTNLLFYGIFFIWSIDTVNSAGSWWVIQNNMIGLLIWGFILFLHTALHCYNEGRQQAGSTERQAYRDGVADTLRHFAEQGSAVERLSLRDDGELEPVLDKRKRQHS
jgi:hypothetical protein